MEPPAYNTVQTVTERLTRKGVLRRGPDGQAFRYEPTQSRDEHTVTVMLDALNDSPDQAAILARFADSMAPRRRPAAARRPARPDGRRALRVSPLAAAPLHLALLPGVAAGPVLTRSGGPIGIPAPHSCAGPERSPAPWPPCRSWS